MTKKELINLEREVAEEVLKRRRLGGYSADAAGILLLAEALLGVIRHINALNDKGGRK